MLKTGANTSRPGPSSAATAARRPRSWSARRSGSAGPGRPPPGSSRSAPARRARQRGISTMLLVIEAVMMPATIGRSGQPGDHGREPQGLLQVIGRGTRRRRTCPPTRSAWSGRRRPGSGRSRPWAAAAAAARGPARPPNKTSSTTPAARKPQVEGACPAVQGGVGEAVDECRTCRPRPAPRRAGPSSAGLRGGRRGSRTAAPVAARPAPNRFTFQAPAARPGTRSAPPPSGGPTAPPAPAARRRTRRTPGRARPGR